MPAIRGTPYTHPQTLELGYWIELLDGSIIGISQTQLNAIRLTGTAANRIATLRVAVVADLLPKTEIKTPLSNWSLEDQDWLRNNPEPYCRVEGDQYIAQPIQIEVRVLDLAARMLQITISEGASKSVINYG